MTLWRFARAGLLAAALGVGCLPLPAQDTGTMQLDLANLREDVRLLTQKVGELSLTVEQLQRDNADLKGRASQSATSYVTLTQLNQSIAELDRSVKAALNDQRSDILQQVGTQLEALAKQTQAAIDAVAKNTAAAPVTAPAATAVTPAAPKPAVFTEDYSKDGASYTVQHGETLSEIARKNNASVRDIINANKITDPAKIQAGQTLFIPSAKKN